MILGSLSRAGPLPLLRQPPIMQPPLDLKQILPFPLEPAPTLGLFSNYSTRPFMPPELPISAPVLGPASGAGSGPGRRRLPFSGPARPHSPEPPGQRAPRPRPARPGQARPPRPGPPPRAMEPRPPGSRRMDPVQKAVLSHTFGGPLLKTKRPIISCNVCQIRFNSQSQAEAHYKGNRHARRVKGIEAAKTRGREPSVRETGDPAPPGGTPPNGEGVAPRPVTVSMENGLGPAPGSPEKEPGSPSPPSVPETGQGVTKGEGGTPAPASLPGGSKEEEEKAKRLLYCALCKVAVNSLSQLEAHNKGTKHKTILEARSGLGPIKAYPRLGPPTPGEPEAPAQDRTFHCEICNVKVNSEVQLKQHISSRRHRDGVAGKPNPLLSRHKKPRGAGELAGTLTFSKELPKSLAGGLLPSPLAVAAVMAAAAGSPLSLRPAPAAPLLQGPPITHPLLHPAPGPIRTAHGPILFSPY
ncbi:zinc finger protein 385A isoform X2 [Balaenoptera musculus]|uniref:Zinc finger protein 385A n=1 Tax=Balaenoptera musculus TaxID=9771 RepID=A0A8B8YTY5_BALMU|nr:zinc finger protein 385A isoform X2 [Balaenoptera musculus]